MIDKYISHFDDVNLNQMSMVTVVLQYVVDTWNVYDFSSVICYPVVNAGSANILSKPVTLSKWEV